LYKQENLDPRVHSHFGSSHFGSNHFGSSDLGTSKCYAATSHLLTIIPSNLAATSPHSVLSTRSDDLAHILRFQTHLSWLLYEQFEHFTNRRPTETHHMNYQKYCYVGRPRRSDANENYCRRLGVVVGCGRSEWRGRGTGPLGPGLPPR